MTDLAKQASTPPGIDTGLSGAVPAAPAQARYVVGIDLGTSHVAVAYQDMVRAVSGDSRSGDNGGIRMLPIAQLVGPGQVAEQALLPSLRYHPAAGELDAASREQPWPTWQPPVDEALAQAEDTYVHQPPEREDEPAVLGQYARALGAQVPGRLVASAKSWLSHAGVDRTAAILPWGAPPGVARISPLHATASYLAHVRSAWDRRFPEAPLAAQPVTVTVPASFDEGARALTVQAAALAGLPRIQLLEEPQAAMSDWLHGAAARVPPESAPAGDASALGDARLVLVVDVGGGTTDFSLMGALRAPADGQSPVPDRPRLVRLTVGDHLMLGGDNMDLAIAHALEPQLVQPGEGRRMGAARFAQLVQRCRAAKEQLLAADAPESVTVTVLGAGARVMGASRSATLTREQVRQWVVDGFMPREGPHVMPVRRQAGLVGFGLPHPHDSTITRHLAAFLARSAAAMREWLGLPADAPTPVPEAVLFNGGVFHAPALAQRLLDVLSDWRGQPVRLLHNPHPDWAVARGAAAHAGWRLLADAAWRARHAGAQAGLGAAVADAERLRIRAGSARSQFLLLDEPGASGAAQAICLLPHGQAEGEVVQLPQRFALRLGQTVRFQVLASSLPTARAAGEVVDVDALDAVWLPPLVTRLGQPDGAAGEVQVRLQAHLSEVGVLHVACVADEAETGAGAAGDPAAGGPAAGGPAAGGPAAGEPRRWPLNFAVRGAQTMQVSADTRYEENGKQPIPHAEEAKSASMWPAVRDAATALVERVFGDAAQAVEAREVRQLRQQLERRLGPRDAWRADVLRPLADALLARARRRRRSPDHERVWLNLTGYCLRPGLGALGDVDRMEAVWPLFEQGLSHPRANGNWAEWWIFWRRVAAGLDEARQMAVMGTVAQAMEHAGQRHLAKDSPLVAEGDMVRLVAVLENLSAAYRAELGEWLLQRLARPAEPAQTWWALGRTGSRVPLHGSPHNVVAPELVQPWIAAALAQDWRRNDTAMFAAVQMARLTGDRARDVDEATREQVLQRLAQAKAPERWRQLVTEVVAMTADDLQRSVGDALPPGLRLLAA